MQYVMSSVANVISTNKIRENGTMEFGRHGINLRKPRLTPWVNTFGEKQGKRGKQVTFSRTSSRNLKKKLVNFPLGVDGYSLWGVTLTLKAQAYIDKGGAEFFRKMWTNYTTSLIYHSKAGHISPSLFFCWRIELTQIGTPHFHLVVATPMPADVLFMSDLWIRLVKNQYEYDAPRIAAINVRRIDSCSAAFAYVSAHASKHKKDQLGWQGRQWGMCFPSAFAREQWAKLERSTNNVSYVENFVIDISRKQCSQYLRIIRKMVYSILRGNDCYSIPSNKRANRRLRISSRRMAHRRSNCVTQFLGQDSLLKFRKMIGA